MQLLCHGKCQLQSVHAVLQADFLRNPHRAAIPAVCIIQPHPRNEQYPLSNIYKILRGIGPSAEISHLPLRLCLESIAVKAADLIITVRRPEYPFLLIRPFYRNLDQKRTFPHTRYRHLLRLLPVQ